MGIRGWSTTVVGTVALSALFLACWQEGTRATETALFCGEIEHVAASPGWWSGIVLAEQEVNFRVTRVWVGSIPEDRVKVTFLLLRGFPNADRDEPQLKRFFKRGVELLVFGRRSGRGQYREVDERVGAIGCEQVSLAPFVEALARDGGMGTPPRDRSR